MTRDDRGTGLPAFRATMVSQALTNLLPKIPKREKSTADRTFWQATKTITFVQWALLFSGWLSWTSDAMDFFSVSLSVKALGTTFNRQTTDITTSITLTLLFRSLGALIFDSISDRYGRKWPLVFNLLCCCIFELATGFTQTFAQFLALRSLFGIAMGGVWGMASSTALESLPVEVRGVASGIIQGGYEWGYILAAVVNIGLVPKTSHSWRTLFWTSAGISWFAALVRALLPESEFFLRAREAANASGTPTKSKTRVFFHETGVMLSKHWRRAIYVVLLMTGFNFLSHGSQDLYPTFLEVTKHFSDRDASVLTIIANCGAVCGAVVCGTVSQYIGRRTTLLLCMIMIGAFVPLWVLPSTFGALAAGGFFLMFSVHGGFGIMPIHLAELSPPAFRAVFPGLAYQLGNMISSAAAQIEATAGQHQQVIVQGKLVPNYTKVQGILIGTVAAYTFVIILIGPENHGRHFELHKAAFQERAGEDEALNITESEKHESQTRESLGSSQSIDEKKGESHV